MQVNLHNLEQDLKITKKYLINIGAILEGGDLLHAAADTVWH